MGMRLAHAFYSRPRRAKTSSSNSERSKTQGAGELDFSDEEGSTYHQAEVLPDLPLRDLCRRLPYDGMLYLVKLDLRMDSIEVHLPSDLVVILIMKMSTFRPYKIQSCSSISSTEFCKTKRRSFCR